MAMAVKGKTSAFIDHRLVYTDSAVTATVEYPERRTLNLFAPRLILGTSRGWVRTGGGRRYAMQVQRLVPQGEGLERTQYACWEYLGRWLGR